MPIGEAASDCLGGSWHRIATVPEWGIPLTTYETTCLVCGAKVKVP